MRMLDTETDRSLRLLQLYLTAQEARELRDGLSNLLADPEENEHIHLFDQQMATELSYSIVTEKKLRNARYTKRERDLFAER